MRFLIFTTILFLSIPAFAGEQHDHHHSHKHKPIYGPIGVMGDHTMNEGEWMTTYRHSSMLMKGNRKGSNDVSIGEVLGDFMLAPLKMTMEMHMFGLMYGVNDRITLAGMAPYTKLEMDVINGADTVINMKSEGIGDLKLTGVYNVLRKGNSHLFLNGGFTIPTGSIDERGTSANSNLKLAYPMQLGSGTYDLLPGVTYTDKKDNISWGAQISSVIRTGENDNDYTLGNQYNATAWGAYEMENGVAYSFRLDAKAWGNIDGADSELNPAMVPTARTDLRGGERLDVLVGVSYQPESMDNVRLSVEGGIPAWQSLDGPQLETDYRLTVGLQIIF